MVSMTYTLGVLLATTLGCVGLVALWAAGAGRWAMLRWLAFLAIIAPPLAVEADEVFVGCYVLGATVGAGVWLGRWWFHRADADPRPLWAFSMGGLLTLTAAVAVAAAMGARLEFTHYQAWGDFALIGLVGGLCTLVGAWMAVEGWSTPLRRTLLGCLAALLLSLTLVQLDEFTTSLRHGVWPQPQFQMFLSPERYEPGSERYLRAVWTPVCIAVTQLTAAAVGLARAAQRPVAPRNRHAKLALLGVIAAVAAPPVWVGAQWLLPWRSTPPPVAFEPPPSDLPVEALHPLMVLQTQVDDARGGTQHDYVNSMKGLYRQLEALYPLRATLPVEDLARVSKRLRAIEGGIQPYDSYRWQSIIDVHQRTNWHRRLREILCRWDRHHSVVDVAFQEDYYADSRAMLRLFQVEFALHAYQAEHGEWPEGIAELVPNLLPEAPIDPCSPVGGPLRYRRESGGYLLYSVGNNGRDDAGKPPKRVRRWVGWPHQAGDITLRSWFEAGEE